MPDHVATPITIVANHRLQFQPRLIGWRCIASLCDNADNNFMLLIHRKNTAVHMQIRFWVVCCKAKNQAW